MLLTDTKIRSARPQAKTLRLFDGGGLYLELSPSGGKWWRLKYRFDGREKRLSFGVYPTVSLKEAREEREKAKKLLAQGINPIQIRQSAKALRAQKLANNFEAIAREFCNKPSPSKQDNHGQRLLRRFEIHSFPAIGSYPIDEIKAPQLLAMVSPLEKQGKLETAHRLLQTCSQVFRYAIATGRTAYNPVPDLRGALAPIKKTHMAALTEPKDVAHLLRAIDGYEGYFVTKCALRLAPLFFVRPGELRQAEWSEFDFEKAEWNIPAGKMKMKEPHLVPLSRQAIEILKELHPHTGGGRYVFPNLRTITRPMSNMAMLSALRAMGYGKDQMTAHGFRAMARTILDQVLGFRPDIIEHQLAHAVRDPLGRAYNRTTHLPERRQMMQEWADYLDVIKKGGQIIAMYGHTA